MISILLNPAAVSRDEISNYSDSILLNLLFIAFVFIFIINLGHISISTIYPLLIVCIPGISLAVSVTISCLYHGQPLQAFALYQAPFLSLIGYFMIRDNKNKLCVVEKKSLLLGVYFFGVILVTFFCIAIFLTGKYYFAELAVFGIRRPQVSNGIYQSTEFANVVAPLLIAGLLILKYGNPSSRTKTLMILCNIALFLGLIALFSTAALLLIVMIFGLMQIPTQKRHLGKLFIGIIFIGFIIVAILQTEIYSSLIDFYNYKSTDMRRTYTYYSLYENIKENPVWGTGFNTSVNSIGYYAHQNILGIWAECGFLTLVCYLVMFIIPIYGYFRYRTYISKGILSNNDIIYMGFCVYTLIFFHIKGFAQDTWYEKINFLLTASLMAYFFMPFKASQRSCGADNTTEDLSKS